MVMILNKNVHYSLSVVSQIPSMSARTFYRHQRNYAFPTVFNAWAAEIDNMDLPSKLDLAGDGRYEFLSILHSAFMLLLTGITGCSILVTIVVLIQLTYGDFEESIFISNTKIWTSFDRS